MALFFPNRTSLEKSIIDAKWWAVYQRLMRDAVQLAEERGRQYNVVGSMPDYFPTPRDLLHMMKLKCMRIESGIEAGENPMDGVIDLVNYTAYLGALLEIGWWKRKKFAETDRYYDSDGYG